MFNKTIWRLKKKDKKVKNTFRSSTCFHSIPSKNLCSFSSVALKMLILKKVIIIIFHDETAKRKECIWMNRSGINFTEYVCFPLFNITLIKEIPHISHMVGIYMRLDKKGKIRLWLWFPPNFLGQISQALHWIRVKEFMNDPWVCEFSDEQGLDYITEVRKCIFLNINNKWPSVAITSMGILSTS